MKTAAIDICFMKIGYRKKKGTGTSETVRVIDRDRGSRRERKGR